MNRPTPKAVFQAKATLKAEREARKADRPIKFAARPFPKADRGRVRDPGFLAFLRRLPCVAGLREGGCSGPVEAAHLRYSDAAQGRVNPGLSVKPSDKFATPLCSTHHRHDQHLRAERAFWERLEIEPGALAGALYETYLAGGDGLAVLREFTRRDAA